jgi:ESCRT-II complex subunit VPS25
MASFKEAQAFTPPAFYNFKPFFTLQPVRATREKQLKLWRELIFNFHVHHKSSMMSDPYSFALFKNEVLNRELSREGVNAVIDSLIGEGLAEWEDSSKASTNLIILTTSPAAVANQVYEWANDSGLHDTILTFYELHSGDGYIDAVFADVDRNILRKALDVLVDSNRAIVIPGESADEDGIKFT